jgi:hypothetical protein
MKRNYYIITTFMTCLIWISCGHSGSKKKIDEIEVKEQVEQKYTKVISDSTNRLIKKIENLEVKYTVWGCACPQWIHVKDTIQINNEKSNYIDYHFYLEPDDKSLELPAHFDPFEHTIKVTGQFYEREDYPQGTIEMEEPMRKAKVFRYTQFEIREKPNRKGDNK